MPTLSDVRDRADQWLSDQWSLIQDRQKQYFNSHGRHFQAKRSHSRADTPDHGDATFNDKVPDQLPDKPTDVAESWLDVLPELDGNAAPARMRFDVYEAPQGHGYTVTLYTLFKGTPYQRTVNVGPEAHREAAWHEVVTEESL